MPSSPALPGAAVVVRGLVKRYGDRAVVDGLSLEAAPGQVTAVLGPNGAGKTTTIECCEGLRAPDEGTVHVLGLDPRTDAAALRPRVGVMLQDGGLPTGVRAVEMLRHVAAMYARPRDVAELVERLGLASFARTTVRRLSGGQRQRLALAAAVVGRPEVVFLDEPSAGMDPQSRLAVWELVHELRADGVAIVLTTHLMDEAEQLADVVHVVDHGSVIASGTVPDLLASSGTPDGETSVRFEAPAGLPLDGLSSALGAAGAGTGPRWTVAEPRPGSYVVTGPADPAAVAALTAWLADRDALVSSLTVGRRTLEDVFLDLTGRHLR
ncbi:ABC transporter ATP-binding protein [Xylanimonas oleitrophica]|uniref:ABC transporter ATP-binding protein n=1 Tax=Xylanimonas oleitrophica TaxID=2607479 RepID=A0A2W5WMY5_9MICO|nr:ABC transporter ATP-binding protein [Xylanimonas oleitrophica]PZR52540.1 ABC transporter ATP-binding protein [Xylanimonas oleitrophica]